jgi:hypothetical protein
MKASYTAGLALLGLAALAGSADAQAPANPGPPGAARWDKDDWNPHAQPDDFVLPLPCNGTMAFRRVVTGPPRDANDGNFLEDRLVMLGSPDAALNYVAYLHNDFVAGGFYESNGRRYYLIGKYEVTVQQYEAVMNGDCRPTPPEKAALPASNLSWFDAVEFSRKLNKWLYSDRLDALPKNADRPGFVRLPSEVEWEFAARGGLAVSDAERANATFVPAGGNLTEYAWFAAPESAAGELKLIGSLKPNPLGLYDMLGNVEELVFEPFRLNRVGRLHGQWGGLVARGGSIETPRDALQVSTRTEFPLFEATTKAEMRRKSFGFRLVIGAVTITGMEQASAIGKQWDKARRMEATPSGKTPLQLLEGLQKEVAIPAQKATLQAAITQINSEVRGRNEVEGRAVKGLLNGAMALRMSLNWTAVSLNELNSIATIEKDQFPADFVQKAKAKFDGVKPYFDNYASAYADIIQRLGTDFKAEEIAAQAQILKNDLLSQSRGQDISVVDAAAKDIAAYRDGSVRETSKILRSVVGPRPWLRQ